MKSENGSATRSAQRETVITVKADLLSPLDPLLDELKIPEDRKTKLKKKLALRNYDRGNYILRDVLMFALDSL